MIKISTVVLATFLATLPACSQQASDGSSMSKSAAATAQQPMMINGSFGYRERMALPPGSRAVVTLSDVSRMDAPATVLAVEEFNMDGRSVPVDYSLGVDPALIHQNMTYAVRAEIRGPGDELMWTTDRAHHINTSLQVQNLDPIMLVKVDRAAAGNAGQTAGGLTAQSWTVGAITGSEINMDHAPTITFADGGKVSGSTGCNNFSGTYTFNNGIIELGPLAMTKKACFGPAADNEAAFVKAINTVDRVGFNQDGGVTLTGPDGVKIMLK